MSIGSPISYTAGGWGAKYNTLALPKQGLLVHAKRFDPTILAIADKMGDSRRTIQDLQYCQCDGTGYFAGTLTGSETVVSKQGTATVTFASGRMNVGAGTLWSVVLSNGSRYEFATKIGDTSALLMDVSGNGKHLVATSFTDIAALCATSKVSGSDHLNKLGYTVNTNTYAPETVLIPARTDNHALDALGNAVGYPGRCKLDVVPVDGSCATFNGSSDRIITELFATYRLGCQFYYDSAPSVIACLVGNAQGNPRSYLAIDATGKLAGGLGADAAATILAPTVLAVGYHEAYMQWDATTVSLILDGATVFSKRRNGNPVSATHPLMIGCLNNSSSTIYFSKYKQFAVIIDDIVFPLTEGAGTTVQGYGSTGTVYTGTVTSSALTAFWAGRQSTFFPGLQYGYRQWGAIQVPANPYTSGYACDGQPLDPASPTYHDILVGTESTGMATLAYV